MVLLVVADAISCLMVCVASKALVAFLITLISSEPLGFVGVMLLFMPSTTGLVAIGCTAGGEVSWLLPSEARRGEYVG